MTDKSPNPERDKRRDASANFIVQETEVSASIELRDAMETAHKSLADSLQLSFRALQVVMVVLVVLYLISGFRTVEDSQTGVSTFFGAIVDDAGLAPGLQLNWPPPIGGFEMFKAQHRESDVGNVFKPQVDARLSPEMRISKSRSSDGLTPGRDGSLLTSGGDLAHLNVRAEWEIIDPIQYAVTIPDSKGSEVVRMILQQSIIHIVANISLEVLLDKPLEELRSLIQIQSQGSLNALQCGIRISDVSIPSDPEPPLFIQRSYAEFDSARIQAETNVERATAQAHETLIQAAGSKYEELLALISKYELFADTQQTVSKDQALENINAMLEAEDISGKVAYQISTADGYRAQIETTLGQDFKRFQSLLPAYREHPDLVIQSRWLAMYSKVIGNADAETFFVPDNIKTISLGLSGSDDIAQLRHRQNLAMKKAQILLDGARLNPWILRARDINIDGPSRELSIIGGSVQGRQD